MNYTKYTNYVLFALFVISTLVQAEDIDSNLKSAINIANTTIQLEISDLKKQYKDDLEILYEDMSRKGQLNGTPMLGRLSKFCLNEIDGCALLIRNTLLRVIKDSGVSYSDKLAAELKNIVKSHLTGEIGNINGYIKQKNKLGPTLEAQLAIKETELNNKRSNELKKINSEIDLLAISLKNQEKQLKRPDSPNSSWLSSTFNISKIIWWVLGILGAIIAGIIIPHCTKSPHQKQINLKSISNKGVISQTTISSDVKGEVVEGDKILTAALKGDVNTLKALLEKGVSPNTINQIGGGETPLMYAMGQNRFECAKLLLEFGADANIRAKDGHTVLDDIKSRPEMLKLIEKYGTKRQ